MFLDYDFKSSNYFYILVDGPRTSGDLAEHLRSTSWTTQEPIGNVFTFRHVFLKNFFTEINLFGNTVCAEKSLGFLFFCFTD